MATKTSNYEFNKPEQNDFYDVDVQNENWDKVDEELSEFDDSGVTEDIKSFPDFLSKFVTGNKVAITLRNLKAGLQFVLHAGQIVNNCVTDNTGLPLSAAQGKVLKDLIDTTNNNLSKYNFNLGDTTANNHKNIDRIATFSGGAWISKDYNADFGGQWCFVDSFLIDGNGAAMQRIMSAQTNTVLATRYCEKNVWGDWNIGVTKSDLKGLDATLSIREENGGVIVSFGSKDSKNGIYIGVGPNGVNANYKLNGEWKKAIIIATKS